MRRASNSSGRFLLLFVFPLLLFLLVGCLPEKKVSEIAPLDLSGPIATLTVAHETANPPTSTVTLLPSTTPAATQAQQVVQQNGENLPTYPVFKLPAIATLRPLPEEYEIAEGDTISKIANRYQVSKKALVEANGLDNPDIISVGSKLVIPAQLPELQDNGVKILPDSELIYGPAVSGFSVIDFLHEHPNNYILNYIEPTPTPLPKEDQPEEPVEFIPRDGVEILNQIALQNSINPKVLMALMEFQTGTISNVRPNCNQRNSVIVHLGTAYESFARQLAWAADTLNYGYYQWKNNQINQWILDDDTIIAVNPNINPGTAALQYFFSKIYGKEDWLYAVSDFGFTMTYKTLFGKFEDGFFLKNTPTNLPSLALPFPAGEFWSFTSGPHYGWSNGTPWAALDFVPPDAIACGRSDHWVTASAPGEILYSNNGLVIEDLDGDHDLSTGWLILYLHLETRDRIEAGTTVQNGDHLGHASCEGGISNGSHVHIARRYNGEWVPIDGDTPMILSGWEAFSAGTIYDGYLVKDGEIVEAWYFKTEASEISY